MIPRLEPENQGFEVGAIPASTRIAARELNFFRYAMFDQYAEKSRANLVCQSQCHVKVLTFGSSRAYTPFCHSNGVVVL